MAGRNGGKRPGAGRKPKAVKYKSPIEAAEGRIRDRLPELIDNLFKLASGVTVQKAGKDGDVDIFGAPPDRQANEYLINRVMGKPEDRHRHEFAKLSDAEILARAKGCLGGAGPARPDAAR